MKTLWGIRYRLWLLCGGRRTESGFRFLSKDIVKNRKLIGDLRIRNLDLEFRLWELEDHTAEESMQMLLEILDEWENMAHVEAAEAAGGEA